MSIEQYTSSPFVSRLLVLKLYKATTHCTKWLKNKSSDSKNDRYFKTFRAELLSKHLSWDRKKNRILLSSCTWFDSSGQTKLFVGCLGLSNGYSKCYSVIFYSRHLLLHVCVSLLPCKLVNSPNLPQGTQPTSVIIPQVTHKFGMSENQAILHSVRSEREQKYICSTHHSNFQYLLRVTFSSEVRGVLDWFKLC